MRDNTTIRLCTVLCFAAILVSTPPAVRLHAGGHAEHEVTGGEMTGHTTAAHSILPHSAWIRAGVPGDVNGAAYLILENHTSSEVLLTAVRGELADRIELHTHTRVDGLMRMVEVPSITVPAGGAAVLEPGGYHIMLLGIRQPFVEGETHSLVLEFDSIPSMDLEFIVRPIRTMGHDQRHEHRH
jgi:periplasmic copper chaperone A